MKGLIEYKLGNLRATEECKDLLRQLLVLDHKERMDKIKFFSHPFVKTAPEIYKNNLKLKLDNTVLLHLGLKKHEEYSNVSESETVFYSSHQ